VVAAYHTICRLQERATAGFTLGAPLAGGAAQKAPQRASETVQDQGVWRDSQRPPRPSTSATAAGMMNHVTARSQFISRARALI